MIVQKINIQVDSSYMLAFKYFSILSVLNDMNMVKRDIQLLAYAVSENKDVSEIKEEFIEKFSTSKATVGNIISKLYKLNVLKKNKRVVSVNPLLLLDFSTDMLLATTIRHGDNKG